jgi:predicted lipid-binding transport protein (Tim44 family)
MNRKSGILASLIIAASLFLGNVDDAFAKRMGGGNSFGSKPSYSQPYQHPSSPAASQPAHSPSQQQAAGQNQAARQNWANRGGLMGMLGGIALGGLLGSLFFGGAFESLNIMDFLIFAAIAYLVYRLIAARSANQNQAVGNAYARNGHNNAVNGYQDDVRPSTSASSFNTDVLFSKEKANNIPANFDQTAFLGGAERAYRHLQACWDNRDLASIRGLTTDKVFAEIQDQIKLATADNKTEILSLRSQLLSVSETAAKLEASVLFETLMKEDNGPEEQVKEVWHFVKPVHSQQSKWFLDGIQQVNS